jgi:hypothetical protein
MPDRTDPAARLVRGPERRQGGNRRVHCTGLWRECDRPPFTLRRADAAAWWPTDGRRGDRGPSKYTVH